MTNAAPEMILSASAPADGPNRRSLFVNDPTTGALVVRPEYRAKVEKALMREARRIKFAIYRKFAHLYFEKLLLQWRGASLKLFHNSTGYFR
jgi:hypothetical protein